MSRPFVSVLIDTYNHERFIEEAISSVLAQDFPASDREILVVDDGSTDRTPEILSKFATQVRMLRKVNGGQASAFNFGIPRCRGEIVAFLDGDDWWAPGKLATVVNAMTADSSLGIVGHGIVSVFLDGREQAETLRENFRFQADTVEGAHLLRRRSAFLGTSRMTIRSELLRNIGPVPEAIEIQADEYLFTLAAVLAPVEILPALLTFYRIHEANRFQLSVYDPERIRRKQESLTVLARTLLERMESFGIQPLVGREVVAYTQACADQMRLQLDGGWPWETVATEWKLYRILHPDAAVARRVFKSFLLAAALFVGPKFFYGAQRRLSQSDLYRRTRARWLPAPEMKHLKKDWLQRRGA